MIRLLNSNFARLRMNGIFRISLVFSAFMGIFSPLYGHRRLVVLAAPASSYSLDYHFFTYVNVIAFIVAAFCSFYVGIEYSDGTLRNKIAVGHSRTAVYFANFITNVAAACAFYTIYIILAVGAGIPLIGTFRHFSRSEIVVLILCVYAVMASLGAVITMVAMLVSNKAVSLGICICTAVIALCIGLNQLNMLTDAAFWQDSVRVEREITLFLLDFLPGSQLMEFFALKDGLGNLNPYLMFSGSAFFAALSTGIGLIRFQQKDIT